MTEKYTVEYSDGAVSAIDRFAAERGCTRADAIHYLIGSGAYVSDSLLAGKTFIVKDGPDMFYVDWNMPPSRDE
jgi:hypothetical protein